MRNFYPNLLPQILVACALIFCSTPLSAQTQHELLLRTGNHFIAENLDAFVDQESVDAAELVAGRYYRIVQFHQLPTEKMRAEMAMEGIQLLDYLPRNAYFTSFDINADRAVLAQYNVRSVVAVKAEYKMTLPLFTREFPEWAMPGGGMISINFMYYRDVDADIVAAAVSKMGSEVTYRNDYSRVMTTTIPVFALEDFARQPFISFIEPIDPPNEPDNYTGRTLHRSNTIATDYGAGRHYDGTGVAVMMQDDGTIGPHIDYQGRVEHYVGFNQGDHGDHVAGIIMGAGNLDPKAKGNAYGADLYVYGAASAGYPGFDSITTHYNTLGIVITSTSYSNGCNAGYTSLAQTMDNQVRTLPALMHVFSAGNSGTSNCGYGAGSLWGNVTGGHKIGKNVIAVANLDLNDGLANSSSRGPAHDGRIKPDVSAKGSSVNSTVDVNDYDFKSGTSMSCPGTSGTLAQLYQAYRTENSGNDPDGGLMKAILMNSADDLGNTGPDFKYGWGRINALKAVRTIEDVHYMTSSISQNGSGTHTITVPGNVSQLKVMVYWTDWEAASNANVALVNDLDMTLTDPNSASYNPWILDHTPNTTTLDLPATTGVDHLNNVEQVVVNNPMAGTYTVNVSGFAVPQGPQKYYVIYEFLDDEVELTYPIGGEPLVPGETEKIRWDAFGNSSTFMVEYSTNNGANWTTIASSVNASRRYLNWTVPNNVTGQALVRVTRGSSSDQSDAPFSIIGVPQNLSVAYVCPDSIGLDWSNVTSATSYEASMLGQKYMDSVATSNTSQVAIYGLNPFQDYWFSAKALGANNIVGRRAIAIFMSGGITNCPIPVDAGIAAITNPAPIISTCADDLDITVEIQISNGGQVNILSIPLRYQIDNNPVVNEVDVNSIIPGGTNNYTFTATQNLPAGQHTLTVWVDYPNDANSWNDTVVLPFEVVGGSVTLPWSENFDSFTSCGTTSDCEATNCDLENGFVNAENLITDDIDWRTHTGATPSGQTGPNSDHTSGVGKYVYLEASQGQTGCIFKDAYMMSPCIDLSNTTTPKVSFWYHMSGNTMGELHLDVMSNNVWIPDVMNPISGNQGGGWQTVTVDLTSYAGQIINLRWRGITGSGFNSDIAIDDISVNNPPVANFSFTSAGQWNDIQFSNLSQFGTSYSWDFGDGSTSTNEDPAHTYAQAGFYTVTLVATNDCGTDTLQLAVAVVETGLEEAELAKQVAVFPNPSNGIFQLNITEQDQQSLQIEVTDVSGRLVHQNKVERISGQYNGQIDLSGMANGIYYLKLTVGSTTYQTKLGVF